MSKLAAVDPVTRALVYTSVSQLARFDHSQYGGCQKKWFFRYVLRLPEAKTVQQDIGLRSHEQIEHYLETGQDVLGPVTLAGKHLLPAPGTDLLVEWGLNNKKKASGGDELYPPEESRLRANGVPLLGAMDWVNPRGTYVDPDGVLQQDPPFTIEAGDNKTTGNLSYAKTGEEFIRNTQMVGYAEFLGAISQRLEYVRTSHVNFQTRGALVASKSTSLWPIAIIKKSWEKLGHQVAREMRAVALLTREEDVPGNIDSCRAFNKDCDFRNSCSLYRSASPSERLKLKLKSLPPESKTMSLINRTRAASASPAAPTSNGIPQGTPPWNPAHARTPIQDESTTAKQAVQGQSYKFDRGGAIGMFLSAVDRGGQILYSFHPPGGGTPFLVGPDEGMVCVSTPVAAPPPPPAPAPPVIAAPPPAAQAAPPPQVHREAGAPPPPPPLRAQTGVTPPPPPQSGPPAPGAAPEARKGRGPGKKQLDAAAGAGEPADLLTQVNEAMSLAHGIFVTQFGAKATPEQLLPIWQALLGR